MQKENKERIKPQKVLFVDFNGVISYNPFWQSIRDISHPLHSYFDPIEDLLFRGENRIKGIIDDWMLGKYTSEQIHEILAERLGIPYGELFAIFCADCKTLDISQPILDAIQPLRKNWHCILRTDNMDTLHRWIMPANLQLAEAFDEIQSSYLLGQLKKTDGGRHFVTTVTSLGINMESSVLIDDSQSTCQLFETLGGKAYCTKSEAEVLAVLEKLKQSPLFNFL